MSQKMYPNEHAKKSNNEKNLEEFLHSLYPDINNQDHAFSRPYHFFQDVLITSTLSPNLISFFCILFYISFDFIIVFSFSIQNWFIDFVPSTEIKTYLYVAARIAIQSLTSVFTLIALHLVLYQWISIAIYDPIKHLTPFSATFLHLSFGYFPQLFALVLGLLFGCNMLCNTYTQYATDFSTFLSIIAAIAFLLFAVGYYAYYLLTRYSLIMRRGFFAVYEPPYGIMSMMVFFATAAFFPFHGTEFKHYGTIQSVVLIIWSVWKLFERHRPSHVSAIANVIETKVFLDAFLFPIFSIICSWIDLNMHNIYIVIQIIYLITAFIAALIVSKSYTFIKNSIQDNNKINQDKFPTPISCLMALRIGVIYSLTPFFQLDFLKWIVLWRFSPQLVPDIVRLAFVMKKSLKEFKIPAIALSPFDLISMRFLAFQVRQYEQFISSSMELPSIQQAYEEAERRFQHVETMSHNFWTDRDYEQLSIKEYGIEVFRTQQYIKYLAILFPHIKEIQDLWTNFAKMSIRRPSKAIINKIHPYSHIEDAGNSIYFFLNPNMPENLDRKREKKVDSTTEHFISAFVSSSRKPIMALVITSTMVVFLVGLILASTFGYRTQHGFDQFSYHTRLLALSLSLSLDSVNGADRNVILPLSPYIANTLGISIEDAAQFRNPIFIREKIYQASSAFLSYFEYNQNNAKLNFSFCPSFTLGLLLNMDFIENSDLLIRTCHMLWTSLYSDLSIYEIRDNYNEFIQFDPITIENELNIDFSFIRSDYFQASIIFFVFVVLLIPMILVYVHQIRKVKKLRKSIENIVALKDSITERGEPHISFSFCNYILRCILVLLCLILLFIAYVFQVEYKENEVTQFAKKTTMLSDIARYSTFSLSAALNEIMIKQNMLQSLNQTKLRTLEEEDLFEKLKNISHFYRFSFANSLSESIHSLNMNEDDNRFLSVFTYLSQMNRSISSVDNYSLSDIISDFSQLMLNDEINYDDFTFLLARKMYKDSISKIITELFTRIASMRDMVKDYDSEAFWVYFILIIWLLFLSLHLLLLLLRSQKYWFYGISVLIRRAMGLYPERLLYVIGELLEDKQNYLDGLPMPIIIRNNKGIIVYANQKVIQYTKHSINQTIGQPFSEFFTENMAKHSDLSFSMEIRQFMDRKTQKKFQKKLNLNQSELELPDLNEENSGDGNFDFIVLRDISEFNELESRLKSLQDRISPDLSQLPSTGKLIFIECRFQTEVVNPSVVFSKIETISERYLHKDPSQKEIYSDTNLFDSFDQDGHLNNKCITVISCGASYLNAIARIGCERESIRFVRDLSDKIFSHFRASITFGVASVFSLVKTNSNVVVAGDVAYRASEMTTEGVWGRIYVDFLIVAKAGMQDEIDHQKFEEEQSNENQGGVKLSKSQTQSVLQQSDTGLRSNPRPLGLGKFGLSPSLLKAPSVAKLPELTKCVVIPVSPLSPPI